MVTSHLINTLNSVSVAQPAIVRNRRHVGICYKCHLSPGNQTREVIDFNTDNSNL